MDVNNKTKGKRTIIQNELICKKCNDVIYSKHRHDFNYCKCGSVAVDGGLSYLRRVGNVAESIERSMSIDEEALRDCREALHRSMSMDEDALRDCKEALNWAEYTGRNSLGTVLAIIRVLRQHDMLNMSKFEQ